MNIEKTRIDIIDCAKTYPDGTRGLKPVNLTINPGEVIALLGPSGCGKTTLLRLLAGLETANSGSKILFANHDVTRLPVEKRDIGMVFQNYALFPQMSVETNIAYGLRVRGVPADVQRKTVGELIDLVHLNGLEKKRPGELSGGQRQQEALAIADRLAIMSAGEIIQVGDGESLYRKPAHPFVAQFLGRVNRIERDENAIFHGLISFGDVALSCPDHLKSQTAVLLRPEDVKLVPALEGLPQVTIERRAFLGDRIQLQLKTHNQQVLMAEQPGDTVFRVGDTVSLHLDTTRLMPANNH